MPEKSHAILVLDLGLTNCKSIVFSLDGNILHRAWHAYPTYYPQPGYLEQDPDQWWEAACLATRELWQQHPDLVRQVDGISVTGHMHALVALGEDGRSLEQSLILGDQRSVQAAIDITHELGLSAIYNITGARMDASMPAAKIRWLGSNRPEVMKRTRVFLSCKDYVRSRLTGDCLTDPIDACATSLYDLKAGNWSEDLLRAARIAERHMPEIASPLQIAGPLREDAASALGLPGGIPVIVGSGDDIEVLGNGLMSPGRSLEHFGTTGSILTCSASAVYDPQMALELYPHAEPGIWVLGGSITAAGSALAWASRQLGYHDLGQAIKTLSDWTPGSADSSSLLFLPHLLGERSPAWQPRSRGAWIGLTISQSSADLMRAAFEGTVFALKHVLDSIEALVGAQHMVTVSAREDNDQEWLQLRSNTYNRSLGLIQTSDPTALGAMQLAAVGIGYYKDLREAVARTTLVERVVEPQEQEASEFERRYQLYRQARAMMADYWEHVGSAQPGESLSLSNS